MGDAMRASQCMNLIARMPHQAPALVEQGAVSLIASMLALPDMRLLRAALAVAQSLVCVCVRVN